MCDGVLHCLSCVVNAFLVSLHGDLCKYTIRPWASPRHYTVDTMLFPSGNPFKCHEGVFNLQLMIPPKRFDISPLTGDAKKVYVRSDVS